MEPISIDDVGDDPHWIVPIIQFRGLYISKKSFTPSFFVTSILIGGRYEEQSLFDPQSMLDHQEDLTNPLDLGLDGWDDVSSQGSFDTKVWGGHSS